MEQHQFESSAMAMFITLLPDGNPPGTVKDNVVAMFDGSLIIKDGVSYGIVDSRNRRVVVKDLRKRPDAFFNGTVSTVGFEVFPVATGVLKASESIKLSRLSSNATSKVRRDTT